MTNATPQANATTELPPAARETVDLVATHRRLVVRTTLAVSVLAVLLAVVTPGFLPPNPLTGAFAALFALAAGVAAAVVADSRDPVLRSGRHVAASGGAVVTDADDVRGAAASLHDLIDPGLDEGGPWRFGVTGPDAVRAASLADALVHRLAAAGRRVVTVDLTARPAEDRTVVGVPDGEDWRRAVDLEPGSRIARLRPGAPDETPDALAWLLPRLPLDVEVFIATLPGLTAAVRPLANELDDVLIVSTPGHDAREQLRTHLETLTSWDVPGEVVLVRPEPVVDDEPADRVPPPVAPTPPQSSTGEDGLVRIIESPRAAPARSEHRTPAMAGIAARPDPPRGESNGRPAGPGPVTRPTPATADGSGRATPEARTTGQDVSHLAGELWGRHG